MPLYDFKCIKCDKEWEGTATLKEVDEKSIKCECGGQAVILLTNRRSQHWFKPHWNEEFTGKPVWVKSYNHYKELCVQHKVVSRATGDVRDCYHRHG